MNDQMRRSGMCRSRSEARADRFLVGVKSMRRLLAALTFLCCGWLVPVTASGQKPGSETVDFTILHLNDVYEVQRPRDQTLGGLSRVAALRKKLVEENPRTYTILSGDALSPS